MTHRHIKHTRVTNDSDLGLNRRIFFFQIIFHIIFTISITYTWIWGKHAISCAARPFWMTKSIIVNTTFMDLGDITLLCITLWTLCRRSTSSDAKKPKVSKANDIKTCWLSNHAFSCLATLLDATFRTACPTVKAPTPKPTSGETPVKSTHSCFPPWFHLENCSFPTHKHAII